MAALSAGSGVKGATTNRDLNKLQYAVANDAQAIDTAATGDVFLGADASADYEIKRYVGTDLLVAAGVTATAAELNSVGTASARVLTSASTAVSLTVTQHSNKLFLWNVNSSGTSTVTLPAASGSGVRFHVVNNVQQTQGTLVVTAAGTDVITGKALMFDSTAAADAMIFKTSATSVKATWDRTTKGGIGYDEFVAYDIAANTWLVTVTCNASGTIATPLSA